MPLFTLDEVREVIDASRVWGSLAGRAVRRVCTDSRQVRSGDLFVALRGELFDGHQFVAAALDRGAVAAVVERQPAMPAGSSKGRGGPLLEVPDSLLAYQRLAARHRDRFAIPVVAVTGSNGKTTTKEMVARILAERWRVLKTEANFNNRVGVPQTLLRLARQHQAAVVEMGVDDKGQTTRLAEIARPTAGIITNVGPDHLEFFGTLEASADAKAELLDLLPKDGLAVLNADDPFFASFSGRARCRVVSFGLSASAQVRADGLAAAGVRGMRFRLHLPGQRRAAWARISAPGRHNVLNALAAAAAGYGLGFTSAAIVRGLGRFRPASMRSQVERVGRVTLINDCYNANPASTCAAIDALVGLAGARRSLAVLGDMLELGAEGPRLHREVGEHLARRGVHGLIACGPLARELAAAAREAGLAEGRIQSVDDARQAGRVLTEWLRPGDVVLVKGSRGMQLERAIEMLKANRLKAKG